MKAKYKFICFRETDDQRWSCQNHKSGDLLGWVEWCARWNQYIFEAMSGIIFSADCLADIQDFIGKVTAARKDE